jgi:hypothetical protein
MSHKSDLLKVKLFTDLKHVLGIAVECPVFVAAKRLQVRVAGADVIEKDDAKFIQKGGNDEAPHVLVTPVPMGEHDRTRAAANDFYVIPLQDRHKRFPL